MPRPPGRRKIKRRPPSRPPPPSPSPSPQTSTPTIFRLLPPEIIHQICSILPLPDLGNLRLTCKIFSELSQLHLVRTLHVMYTRKSLSNLLQISGHAKLRKYVRKIVYEPMMLEDMDQSEWEGCMRAFLRDECECQVCEERPLGEILECDVVSRKLHGAWKQYKKMLDGQLLVRTTGYDLQIFNESLSRFPALGEMVVNARPRAKRNPWLERTYKGTLAIEWALTDGGEDGLESCVVPLLCLIPALEKSQHGNKSLRSLKLRSIGWSFFEFAKNFHRVFSQLQILQLRLAEDFDEADLPNESLDRHKNLGAAVQLGAKQLESLDLAFGHQTEYEELVETERETRVHVLWETIFSNKHFPKLHTLRLQNVTCHAEAMSSFFKTHASTLRIINFKSLWLHEPTMEWTSVFETMRDHLSLEKIFLDGYFGGEPTPDQPPFLNLDKNHSIWLAKTIVYGMDKTKRIKEENRLAMQSEMRDWLFENLHPVHGERIGVPRPCQHRFFSEDPVGDLIHYASPMGIGCVLLNS